MHLYDLLVGCEGFQQIVSIYACYTVAQHSHVWTLTLITVEYLVYPMNVQEFPAVASEHELMTVNENVTDVMLGPSIQHICFPY